MWGMLAFAVLGAIAGSFTSVVAERAYTGQSFISGRSRCNSCNVALGPTDLVPLFSWLSSGGRCRSCGSHVSAHYLFLEASLALLFALAYASLGLSGYLALFLAALLVLAFIVVYDLRHTIVPPEASALLALLSLMFLLVHASGSRCIGASLVTAGVIGGIFLALHVFSRGRAMGLGDAPVAFALSLLISPYALSGLLLSFWIGAAFGIAVLVTRRGGPTMGIEVPFVPFLAAGYILAYFTGWNPLTLALL